MSRPFKKIYCEISGNCNLRCDFCPISESPRGFMTKELFTRVVEQVKGRTDRLFLHLMGEPLMHPELDDFLDICREADLSVHIVTNGVLLLKKLESLKSPIIKEVNISLQSVPSCYGEGEQNDRYLNNMVEFIEKIQEIRPELYVNLRLWNMSEYGDPLKENFDVLSFFYQKFDQPIPEMVIGERLHGRSYRLINKIFFNFSKRFNWPHLGLPDITDHGYCMGLSTQLGIHSDGTVVPCCLDDQAVINLGNIGENTLDEILESPATMKIYNDFQNGILSQPLCQKCEFRSRFRKKIKYKK